MRNFLFGLNNWGETYGDLDYVQNVPSKACEYFMLKHILQCHFTSHISLVSVFRGVEDLFVYPL